LFKRLLLSVCLLLLLFSAYASVYVVEPVDQKVLPGSSEVLSFGKVAKGETMRVVIKKKSDLSFDWSRLSVDSGLLPAGWKVNSVEEDKSLIAEITIPKNAAVSTQQIKLVASNPAEPVLSETFYGSVSVQENLLFASIEELSQETTLGEVAKFNLVLNNDSIAGHAVEVRSSLPSYWFSARTIELEPNQSGNFELEVVPYAYGEKNFQFEVVSLENGKTTRLQARLGVKPTLSGMYRASFGGFPFFSPGMLPYYLLNGFLALLG
jgi:hypothetical protein